MSESVASAECDIVQVAVQIGQVIGTAPQAELIAARYHLRNMGEAVTGISAGVGIEIMADLRGADRALVAAKESLEKGQNELSQYLAILGVGGNAAVIQAAGAEEASGPQTPEKQKNAWQAAHEVDLLIDLPPLPHELYITADGEVYVTERPFDELPLPDELHLYLAQRATPQRRAELEEIARKTGTSIRQLATGKVEAAAIEADPRVRRGAKIILERKDSESYIPLLRTLHAAQKAALEQAYVSAIAARGRTLLQQHVPDAVPQEANIVASERSLVDGSYYGKVDGIHIISITPPHIVTRKDVELAHLEIEDAAVVVHELAHQKHAEATDIQLLDGNSEDPGDTGSTAVTDPHDLLKRAVQLDMQTAQNVESYTEQERLVLCLYETLTELYAYTVESEIRQKMGLPPIVENGAIAHMEDLQYTPALVLFLGPNAPVSSAELKSSIFAVDLAAIAALPEEELIAILEDPSKLLTLPKR